MKKYRYWSINDLADMARQRGLDVRSATSDPAGPSKKEYMTALGLADRDAVFHLMKLPPELRTSIYHRLLVFHESWSCCAQLLRTSKEVLKDATDVLYGENLIEIKIWRDVVQAHGKPCGEFSPTVRPRCNRDIMSLHWPEFLRKVQWLRVSVAEPANAGPNMPDAPTVNRIVYSLCSFLERGNQLRSFHLSLTTPLWSHNNDHAMLDRVRYPLAILGVLKKLKVEFGNTANDISVENNTISSTTHAGSAMNSVLELLEEATAVDTLGVRLPSTSLVGVAAQRHFIAIGIGPALRRALALLNFEWFFDDTWEHQMRNAERTLRTSLERLDVNCLEKGLRPATSQTEVELMGMKRLRTAREAAGVE